MGASAVTYAAGDVVVLAFPYSDFTQFKIRPAVIVGIAEFGDVILCQITSQAETSQTAVLIREADFTKGTLERVSYARPDKLVTVDPAVIRDRVGALDPAITGAIKLRIRELFA